MRPPPLGVQHFSSPSASSCARSRSPHDLSPLTPEPCFATAPTIVSPDDFALQIDLQLDHVVKHKSPITRHPASSPEPDPFYPSEGDMFPSDGGLWRDMHDRFTSSPPLRPRVSPGSGGAFPWEATRSALVDPGDLPDPSRCSLLIHEVSLLVGLAADDDHLSPDDGSPLADGVRQVPDILPLALTPTKSLASHRHANTSLPCPPGPNARSQPSTVPACPTASSRSDNLNPYDEKDLPVRSRDPVPAVRHKNARAARPSLPPCRRQGQVFHFEQLPSTAHHRSAVGLDETFSHPREPPPKPAPNPSPNRCSSLDRLEYSLRKLEAHAPGSHRKSQSEGRALDRLTPRTDKRPSLPPPHCLRKQRSMHRNLSRPAVDRHFSGRPPPVPRPIPHYQYAAPQTRSVDPVEERHEEYNPPGSFMDMDIPPTKEAAQKRQASLRQAATKEKTKGLASVIRKVSQGVIAWGKSLAGSTKPSITGRDATAAQSIHVY